LRKFELCRQIKNDGGDSGDYLPRLTDAVKTYVRAGASAVAIIGHRDSFQSNDRLEKLARERFSEEGVHLLTYDELLAMNRVLLDYYSGCADLSTYFSRRPAFVSEQGRFMRRGESLGISEKRLAEVREVILRNSGAVALYGLGNPPDPDLRFTVRAFFDVAKVFDPPLFLKGDEVLLWAGRYGNQWIVTKRRMSEPHVGAVVEYTFLPPLQDGALSFS